MSTVYKIYCTSTHSRVSLDDIFSAIYVISNCVILLLSPGSVVTTVVGGQLEKEGQGSLVINSQVCYSVLLKLICEILLVKSSVGFSLNVLKLNCVWF